MSSDFSWKGHSLKYIGVLLEKNSTALDHISGNSLLQKSWPTSLLHARSDVASVDFYRSLMLVIYWLFITAVEHFIWTRCFKERQLSIYDPRNLMTVLSLNHSSHWYCHSCISLGVACFQTVYICIQFYLHSF